MHTKSEEISNMDAVRKEIAQMQVQDPHKSFAQCWAILQKQKPHLFKTSEDYDQESHPIDVANSLPPKMTFQETMRLFRKMSPAQLVQAELVGMTQDGTPWDKSVTYLCLCAGAGEPKPNRPIISRPFDHNVKPRPQSKLDKRVGELQELNAGMSLKDILAYLTETEPELFPEDERPEALNARAKIQSKQKALRDAVAEHRKVHPEHDFATAYHLTTQEHPNLLEGLTTAISDTED
jgi:hypothetical protein